MQGHNRKHKGLAIANRRRLTTGERLLWMNLRGSNYGPKFRRQAPMYQYILDYYCPAARLCVEVDGPHHEEQTRKDQERDRFLADKLILTIRFTSDQVQFELDWVVDQIVETAKQRIAFFEREGKYNVPEE
jgi:very-short-patch-repair endonuclease